ncbi:MAG TPA: hypothetical protein VIP77_00465 [Jiangellaceae bacterium]
MTDHAGPWEIVERLRGWAADTPWCEWVELGGSLARGAGDAWSDVDAGLGVLTDGVAFAERRDIALAAAGTFAQVADTLVQPYGTGDRPADHLVVQYADGRQLSLVVMPAENRPGLPPGSRAVLDRAGRLSTPYVPPVASADAGQVREWAFLAWWALADVAKHARRASVWRAIGALDEARTHVWQVHAAALGLDYPGYGAVSVENAAGASPAGIEQTLPAAATAPAILAAARALADVLDPLAAAHDVDGVRAEARRRLG